MARGPLQGVRILDLTHVWAGPLSTRILGDLGAQVVKIEAKMGRGPRVFPVEPLGGFIGGEHGPEPYNSNAVFVKLQRNKQSVALDLKSEHGRQTFLELVEHADVVIENFSARAMSRLRLDYNYLKRANPKIIHVAMPGFGLNGPYNDRVAFGPTVEPMSGLTQVMGYSPDEPRSTAMALPDPIAAVHAVSAVLTALRKRELTGKGELVEMSLHESAVAAHGTWIVESQLQGNIERMGNRHPSMAPHGIYQCRGEDQWIAIACRDDTDWKALCSLIDKVGQEVWTLADRQHFHDEIDQRLEEWTLALDPELVAQTLQKLGIPAGHVRATTHMTDDEHVQSRGFFVPLERGTPIPGNPIKMSGISSEDWTSCPPLGSDNRKVLSDWLGYSDERIEGMYDAGVIADRPPK